MPFTGGPSVRVSPNSKIEIRWIADFIGDGKVEVFDNANGGTPIDSASSTNNNEHKVEFTVGGVIQADKTYFFKVTHTDPTGARADLTNDPAPYPPFFTGAQAIKNLSSTGATDSADIAWDANVIGTGAVVYGIGALDQGPVTDNQNIPNHAFTLAGLTAGSTYMFQVSNKHAIDGDALASMSGQFTTTAPQPTPTPTSFVLVQPHAEPRTIDPNQVSTLSIRAQNQGNPVANVVVSFAVDSTSQGSGTLSSSSATTNANGVASVQFTGGNRGNVHVNLTSGATGGAHKITVVVKRA